KENEKLLKQEEQALNMKVKTWKQDILTRAGNLTKRKQTYQEVLENTLILENLQKELEQSLESEKFKLEQNQNQLKILSQELEEKSKVYQRRLNNLKFKQKQDLKEKEINLKKTKEILNQKLTTLEITLKMRKENLNLNLKSLENNQLKELTKEIAKEIPNCPKELNQYLMLGEYQAVLEKDRLLTRDTNHLLEIGRAHV